MNEPLEHILSGKYRIIRPLGNGSSATVFLARHQSLESDRAIKIIPKSQADRLIVLSEARLLKSTHHPGIPTIYDLEEDDQNFYLVEEYIQGESLEQFLLHQQEISLSLYYQFAIQLCEIYDYLHSLPILYQDLKPAHIIVCGNRIKLIDFGSLYSLANEGNPVKIFGNATFSAPEVLHGQAPTVQSDIYSIGKLLEYLFSFTQHSISKANQHIIQHACNPDSTLRYETVEAMLVEIQKEFSTIGRSHLHQTIAVVGAFPGSGATHISIALTSTLNYMGYSCCYQEKNDTNALLDMQSCSDAIREKDGCLSYKWFLGIPKYGPGIVAPNPDAQFLVNDFGSTWDEEQLASSDYILLVCGSAPWHIPKIIDQFQKLAPFSKRVKVICNPNRPQIVRFLANTIKQPVFSYSMDLEPFAVTKDKIAFTTQLLEQKRRFSLFLSLRRVLGVFQKP